MDRRGNNRKARQWRFEYFVLAAVAVVVVGFVAASLLAGPGGYVISNARLEPVTPEGAGPPSNRRWRVVFDARWDGGEGPEAQAQDCRFRVHDRDGVVMAEREFGLHVGAGASGIQAPREISEETLGAAPETVTVEC